MNPQTYALATVCAQSAPDDIVGIFGLDDAVIAIEVIYYGYEFWKACHSGGSTLSGRHLVDDAKITINENTDNDGMNYSPSVLRRAGRPLHRAGRYKGYNLKGDDLTRLTTHMLNTVAKAPDDNLVGCYFESPAAALSLIPE